MRGNKQHVRDSRKTRAFRLVNTVHRRKRANESVPVRHGSVPATQFLTRVGPKFTLGRTSSSTIPVEGLASHRAPAD